MAGTTRDRLLDAGLRAFATRGVDGTAIVDLEEAAGLAAGSGGFYRYFRTKDDLLDAVVRREVDRVAASRPEPDATGAGVAADVRAGDTLRRSLDEALDLFDTLGPLIAVLARERNRIPGLAAEIADRLLAGGIDHDGELVASVRGEPDATDRAVGAVVLSAVVGYQMSAQYFGGAPAGVDRATFVDTLVGLLLRPAP